MPVTLSTPPPSYAFSKNELLVTVASDDIVTTPGVKAVIKIAIGGVIAPGATAQLVWTNRSITMTAALVPDGSGDQFPSGDGSAGYVASLVNYFADNYYIGRDFIVTSAASNLTLTAISAGVASNVVPFAAGQIAITQTTAGVDAVQKSNFKHLLEVWLAGVNVYSETLQLDFNSMQTTKDIGVDILHPNLGSDCPSLSATAWQACPNTLKPYYVKYAQYFGDNPEVKKTYKSPVAYVNRGAFDTQAAVGQTLQGFINAAPAKTLCLRQGSKIISTQPDQPEWLYWINFTGAAVSIALRVQLNCTDGTNVVFMAPTFVAGANQKFYVPVSYDALHIGTRTPAGKTIESYQVRVCTATGTFLSVEYTYQFDRYREFPRYFVYLNSLGGYQTLYTWGLGEDDSARTKTDISRQVTAAQAASTGRNQETLIRIQNSTIVNTGYTTERELALLDDFLLSEERYLVDGARLIPIGLTTDKLTKKKDGQNLKAAQFEYYPLYDELAYTDDPSQDDYTINGGAGSGSAVSPGFDRIQDLGIKDNQIYKDL